MKADTDMLASCIAQKWPRRGLLLGLGLLLFALGQFQDAVFAGLMYAWQLVPGGTKSAGQGLSTHGLPVGISYRLLYCGLSTLTLHILLHGRATRLVAAGYALTLLASMLLLLLGQRMTLPLASEQGHRLLDLICSPLPLLLVYAIIIAGNRTVSSSRPKLLQWQTRQLTPKYNSKDQMAAQK
jgi:hypothetical protein